MAWSAFGFPWLSFAKSGQTYIYRQLANHVDVANRDRPCPTFSQNKQWEDAIQACGRILLISSLKLKLSTYRLFHMLLYAIP